MIKEIFINFLIAILVAIVILFIVISPSILYTRFNNNSNNIKIYDTLYNKVILDSIEYNIVKRDTIIYKIKVKMMYEIEESKHIDDSNVVKLFNSLVAE